MQLIHSRPLEKIGAQLPIFLSGVILVSGLAILLQQIGMPQAYLSQLMLLILLSIYFYSGISAATMSLDAYQNARRCISPFYNGQGLAAGMVSMGVFVLLPGLIYQNGVASLDYFGGWLLATVIMTALVATDYNKSKATTLPAFLVADREKTLTRFLCMVVVITVSGLLLVANLLLIGDLGARIFSIKEEMAVLLACLTIGICLLLGGIQSLTMARIFSYVILLTALFLPLVWTSTVITGNPIPQLSFGTGAILPLLETGRDLIDSELLLEAQNQTITSILAPKGTFEFLATMICIACGLGVMPHLVQHFVVVETPSFARKSGIWAFVFLLLVITAIPAVSAFVHYEIFSALIGLQVSDLGEDSEWLFELSGAGNLPLISVCGTLVADFSNALGACGGGDYILKPTDISLNPEFLMLGTANLHNLPTIMFVLVSLGVMVALWSTADGLILVIANTLSNDFYRNIFRPRSPMSVRLFMTRFWLIVTIVLALATTVYVELDKVLLLETGIALSAATLFPAFVIKIFCRSLGQKQIIGLLYVGLFVFLACIYPRFYELPEDVLSWQGLGPFAAGVTGLLSALVAGYLMYLYSHYVSKSKVGENATISN